MLSNAATRHGAASDALTSNALTSDVEFLDLTKEEGPVELRDQIEAAFRPWRSATTKPPFSYGELIAMILVLHDKPMLPREILRWLANNFDYFGELCFDGYWHSNRETYELKGQFLSAFNEYALPLTEIADKNVDSRVRREMGSTRFSMSVGEARIYLDGQFGHDRQGVFPFLKLPTELRTIIYDMVFAFPLSGLSLMPYNGLGFVSRDFSKPFLIGDFHRKYPPLVAQPISAILNMLRLNRQVWDEAMPRFFANNTFYVPDSEKLSRLLSLPQSYRQHIRHLAFSYSPGDHCTVFNSLKSLKKLRRLDISMDEHAWSLYMGRLTGRFGTPYWPVLEIPGVSVLHSMRGLQEVNFHGSCPTIAAYLKPAMEKPRPMPKRNWEDEDEGERKPPSRAAKKARMRKMQLG